MHFRPLDGLQVSGFGGRTVTFSDGKKVFEKSDHEWTHRHGDAHANKSEKHQQAQLSSKLRPGRSDDLNPGDYEIEKVSDRTPHAS